MKKDLLSESQIYEGLKTIVGKLMKLNAEEVNERAKNKNANLRDDLGIDSVESLDFLHGIEDFFSVTIGDEEAASLRTIADAIALIKKKKNV